MKAFDLLSELRIFLVPQPDLHVLLNFLADRVYVARLSNGHQLQDATDFKQWLQELAKEAKG